MLFQDLILQTESELEEAFNRLFELANKNKIHPGDLLLAMEGAFLSEEEDFENPGTKELMQYYNIGDDMAGYCETTNYKFIAHYGNSADVASFEDYKKAVNLGIEADTELKDVTVAEELTIQIEMLIYIKIWEGETFLKKFYQLVRLVEGKGYDWHCSINGFGKAKPGSFSRRELLEQIKTGLKEYLPALSKGFEECHFPQIRNAISHSQYAILGRSISFNNFEPDKDGSRHGVSFEEWTLIFHKTMAIFHLYTKLLRRIRQYCYDSSAEFRYKKEIQVVRHFPKARTFYVVLYTRPHYMDWSPYQGG